MQQEARDFEALRAELDTRMRELTEETAGRAPGPEAPEEPRAAEQQIVPAPMRPEPALPETTHIEEPLPEGGAPGSRLPTLEEVERRYIVQVLEARNWRVSGPRGAARILGLNPSTLRSRMKKLGISRDISLKR